jgi:branched-chain amino acid transport system substrate-binding protein
MSPARAAWVVAALAGALASGCGAAKRERPVSPAQPIRIAGCSSVTYGASGRPDSIVAASTPLQGQFTDHGIQIVQVLRLVFEMRGWKAGEHRIGLQICDETTPGSNVADPAKCRRNARAFARNRAVIGVIGPHFSSCAAEMLPILNRAPRGPLALVGAASSYLGLTRDGPGVSKAEPERYFPTGRRSYVRVVPADDAQAAADVLFAQRSGVTRAFVLDDGELWGQGIGDAFRFSAGRAGLRVVGSAAWDPKAHGYRALAERVGRAGADGVFLGGFISSNGPRLVKDLRATLGPNVVLLGADGFNQASTLVEEAGAAAEGLANTIATVPADKLPGPGRAFANEVRKRFSALPCCLSVRYAQAAEMLIDAIAASDGTRAQVMDHLIGARVKNGLIGDFSIDRYGDTSLTTFGVYRIEQGTQRFVTALTPPARLLARR